MLKKRSLFFLFALFFSALPYLGLAQKSYKVQDIPDPKKTDGGYVSNPDGILNAADVASLNDTIASFERKTNVQVAVVIVNDFDSEQEDFDFAYNLFNTWGIGQKTSNNGLLLFIAKDRRKYRFITGTGVEGVLPDTKLKHIAQNLLVPAFRENDFGTGIINTLNAIGIIILNPDNKSELNQFFTQKSEPSWWDKIGIQSATIIGVYILCLFIIKRKKPKLSSTVNQQISAYDKGIASGCITVFFLLFIVVFLIGFFGSFEGLLTVEDIPTYLIIICSILLLIHYVSAISAIRKKYFDPENFSNAVADFNKSMWWLVLLSPLVFIVLILEWTKRAAIKKRFTPALDANNLPMVRIDRDENPTGSPYLNEAQQKEEQLKSILYDIWIGTDGEKKLIPNDGDEHRKYETCPSCGAKTYTVPFVKTLLSATYSRQGSGKEMQECKNCSFETFIRNVTIPMLVKERSSSSSSSSGSSSSSSSSWGGGRSSGGGTGGSW
ncbi:TPM domain-containing protein [Pedobacter sp.]|uniref:TPM domain-containing protein n=1 Tax=Pedobacter sp. TaxID=1411316 RepID=UPI003BAD7DB4